GGGGGGAGGGRRAGRGVRADAGGRRVPRHPAGMNSARRELLASRADVWGFLAEPYHLSDWWPGIVSVQPDRRGFATGARWQVTVISDPLRIGPLRFPRVGRPSGPSAARTLVIKAIEPQQLWAFELHRRVQEGRDRGVTPRSVTVKLRPLADDRTEVEIEVETGGRREPDLARTAADRLYDLVQMAATL